MTVFHLNMCNSRTCHKTLTRKWRGEEPARLMAVCPRSQPTVHSCSFVRTNPFFDMLFVFVRMWGLLHFVFFVGWCQKTPEVEQEAQPAPDRGRDVGSHGHACEPVTGRLCFLQRSRPWTPFTLCEGNVVPQTYPLCHVVVKGHMVDAVASLLIPFRYGGSAKWQRNGCSMRGIYDSLCRAGLFQSKKSSRSFSNSQNFSTARQLFAWRRRWGCWFEWVNLRMFCGFDASRTQKRKQVPRRCGPVQTLSDSIWSTETLWWYGWSVYLKLLQPQWSNTCFFVWDMIKRQWVFSS